MQPSLFPPKVKGERDLWLGLININLGLNVETGKYSSADVEENCFQLPPHIQTQERRQTEGEDWKRKNGKEKSVCIVGTKKRREARKKEKV